MSEALRSILAVLAISAGLAACSASTDEQIDKRPSDSNLASGPGGGDLDPDTGPDGGSTVVDDNILNFSGVNYLLAAGSELLDEAFYDNLILSSKVSEGAVILFGRNGSSWLYGAEGDNAPRLIQPLIAVPEDRQLLTMDQNDFWLVGSERVSKRKFDDEVAPNQIVLHNFDLTRLSGQRDQLKVLGATHQTLLLHLASHIAVISVIDGQTAAYEFSSILPGGFEGEILAGGDTTDGGYWLASHDKFAILKYQDQKWHWSFAEIPSNLSQYTSLASRIDVEAQSVSGDSVALNGRVYSVSGAPMAAED